MKQNQSLEPKIPLNANYSIAIVVSDYYQEITENMLLGVSQVLEQYPNIQSETFTVGGSFELPIVCQKVLKNNNFDAAIALGVVVQGETRHFDFVCDGVMSGLMRVMLDLNKVVGFGVLTVNQLNQAKERAIFNQDGKINHSNKGAESAMAVIKALNAIEKINLITQK